MDIEEKAGLFCVDYIKESVLSKKEWSFHVATGSMQPIINPMDRVVVKKCTASDVEPGDIILFERNSALILHRLVRKTVQHGEVILVPKADMAYTEEEAFKDRHLLGRVVRIHKKSMSIYLDRWHGRAINGFFDFYQLFKMKAYRIKCRTMNRFSREMKAEDRLIRLCSVTVLDNEREMAVRKILDQYVDWDYFLKQLQGEDTASLVYRTLNKIEGIEHVAPCHVRGHLKDFYYSVSGKNIPMLHSLEMIAAAFNREKIEIIVFKGLALAQSVYKDVGMRPMGDIDLLVRKEDLAKADRTLRSHGFKPEFEIRDFSAVATGQYRNSIVYRSEGVSPVSLHVHWHIVNFSPFQLNVMKRIDMNRLWDESISMNLDNAHIRTFSLHHNIIYLCMHALNHSFHPLVRLCDINEVLRSKGEEIDWEMLVKDASAFNLSKSVYYTLYLVSGIFNADIPEEVLRRLRPRRIGLIERTFLSSVLRGTPILTGEWLICLGMNESIKDRFLFLWRLLFPSKRELSLIQKKEGDRAGIRDYLKRMRAGAGAALRVMFHFSKQVSLRS